MYSNRELKETGRKTTMQNKLLASRKREKKTEKESKTVKASSRR